MGNTIGRIERITFCISSFNTGSVANTIGRIESAGEQKLDVYEELAEYNRKN